MAPSGTIYVDSWESSAPVSESNHTTLCSMRPQRILGVILSASHTSRLGNSLDSVIAVVAVNSRAVDQNRARQRANAATMSPRLRIVGAKSCRNEWHGTIHSQFSPFHCRPRPLCFFSAQHGVDGVEAVGDSKLTSLTSLELGTFLCYPTL